MSRIGAGAGNDAMKENTNSLFLHPKSHPGAKDCLTTKEYNEAYAIHLKNYKEVESVLQEVFESKVTLLKHVTFSFLYFPPMNWVHQGKADFQTIEITLEGKQQFVSCPKQLQYKTSFSVQKVINDKENFFKATNEFITFEYDFNGMGWKSLITTDVYIPSTFYPTLPKEGVLDLVMQLRLLLQTMLTDKFFIINAAEKRLKNKDVLLTPFKLIRGEKESVYAKYGFRTTANAKKFEDFLIFLDGAKITDYYFSDNVKKRVEAIYKKKNLEIDFTSPLYEVMKHITVQDELDEKENRNKQTAKDEFYLTLKKSHNLSSDLLQAVLDGFNKEKEYKGEKELIYNANITPPKNSINILEYIGGPNYMPPTLLFTGDVHVYQSYPLVFTASTSGTSVWTGPDSPAYPNMNNRNGGGRTQTTKRKQIRNRKTKSIRTKDKGKRTKNKA